MDLKSIAQQLRQPTGELGKQVGLKMNEGNAIMYRYAFDVLEMKPEWQVLEIGMGNGALVPEFFQRESSLNYVGCDFSETMVAEAKQINAELMASGKVDFVMSALHQLPFSNERFDLVFTVNTIYFWDSPDSELMEIKRVLKKEGKLVIVLRPKSVMVNLPFTQYDFNLFEKEDVAALLTKNGFEIEHMSQRTEPDQDINGVLVKMETIVVIAQAKRF